ncbi:hypothetical protein F5887DRAFT_1077402 [Amanita rubescens]|nr:hypothetical protein F5887DRAFT_1077402 [Amanita rubescens]
MSAQNDKRTHSPVERDNRKKRRIAKPLATEFLDVEAADSGSGEEWADFEDEAIGDFIDDNVGETGDSEESESSQDESEAESEPGVYWEDLPKDHRMLDVISSYEARNAASEATNDSAPPKSDVVDSLTELVSRMPMPSDPGVWRVRIWEGTGEESLFVLSDRLKARPNLAISVFWPPGSGTWIFVEASKRENVQDLCNHLSTMPHPLKIEFVPVEERVRSLDWHHQPTPAVTSPSWARLKRKCELKDLLRIEPHFDKRLIKYGKDLAYVCGWLTESLVLICLVPRLLVPIDSGASLEPRQGEEHKRPRKKRLPRLLHPKLLGDPQEALDIMHIIEPNVWWVPKKRYELERVVSGVYQLARRGWKKCVRGGDNFMPPFAYYSVPPAALRSASVVPKLGELKLFGEGMAIGAQQLGFSAPHPDFLRWSYENHFAAPLDMGQKVEAKLIGGMIQGVIEDIRHDEVVVRTQDTREEHEVHLHSVRRFYEVGDKVKVVKSAPVDSEGWVIGVQDDLVNVFDRRRKEEFQVKSWQLIPYDSFEWGFERKIQIGETVQVIAPISPYYQQNGRVCNVSDSRVDVVGHLPNTQFSVPYWFLEVDDVVSPAGVQQQPRQPWASYDRYKELINTDDKGRDLETYYTELYPKPARGGYRIPNFIRVPERSRTPGVDEQIDQSVAVGDVLDMLLPNSESATVDDQAAVPSVSEENQVYAADWLMKDGLVTKRIWAHIRNSNAYPNGFARGYYEGERVLILSGERENEIEVNVKQRTIMIPSRFLCPQIPTSRGQDVVVISGENVGEQFLTRKQKEDGSFPLGRRGHKGLPICTVQASKLARCDPV